MHLCFEISTSQYLINLYYIYFSGVPEPAFAVAVTTTGTTTTTARTILGRRLAKNRLMHTVKFSDIHFSKTSLLLAFP